MSQDPARRERNAYAYGANRPTVAVDPRGLWSLCAEGYVLVGGGGCIGKDPCSGGWFFSARGGVGLGGGVTFNPKGGAPGGGCPGGSSAGLGGTLGASGNVGVGLGPLNLGLGGGGGANFSPNGISGYGGFGLEPAFGSGWGLSAGGSIGLDVGFYSDPAEF